MRNTSLTHLQQSHQGYWFPIQGAPALIERLKHQESSQKEHFQYYLQIQSYKKKKKKNIGISIPGQKIFSCKFISDTKSFSV